MLRVGIIGAGFFGLRHAETLAKRGGAELVAVSRRDPAALSALVSRFGVRGYADGRSLLDDPDVNTVVIATPHDAHTDIAVQAARSGRHILVEKPLALTLADCDTIIAAAREAGVQLMAGHVSQFARAYRTARQILRAGEVGDLVCGTSRMLKPWLEPNRRPWHLDPATGGGMWLTAGMHCLDRLTWLADSPVRSVCAQFTAGFHDQRADDAGIVFLRYSSGFFASVQSVGWKTGVTDHSTELVCTKGLMRIDPTAGVSIGSGERWVPVPESGSQEWLDEALAEEWRAFAVAIERGGPSPVPGDYARHIMSVVLAAQESSRTGTEVPIRP